MIKSVFMFPDRNNGLPSCVYVNDVKKIEKFDLDQAFNNCAKIETQIPCGTGTVLILRYPTQPSPVEPAEHPQLSTRARGRRGERRYNPPMGDTEIVGDSDDELTEEEE